MIISFTYDGKPYVNFNTESDDFNALNIPADKKAEIVADAKWNQIRIQREALMRDTDWTQVTDSQLTTDERTAFVEYRQTLRDLPQNFDDPDAVVWPEKPTL